MILSARQIEEHRNCTDPERHLIITPFCEASLQPASYDLRAGEDIVLSRGICTLVPSMERVELPPVLAAVMRCRSSFARRGVLLGGGFVDPGFRGQLTLALTLLGEDEVLLKTGDRVVQIIFHQVTAGGDRSYEGRYQDSQGAVQAK